MINKRRIGKDVAGNSLELISRLFRRSRGGTQEHQETPDIAKIERFSFGHTEKNFKEL
jgi:hypothetical protein